MLNNSFEDNGRTIGFPNMLFKAPRGLSPINDNALGSHSYAIGAEAKVGE